jgi:hypothetical protein
VLYASFTTSALIEEIRALRKRTGWPTRTDGSWLLLDRLERAEREARMRGLDPDRPDGADATRASDEG